MGITPDITPDIVKQFLLAQPGKKLLGGKTYSTKVQILSWNYKLKGVLLQEKSIQVLFLAHNHALQ